MSNSKTVNPVVLPPGCARLATNPPPDRIGDLNENDRDAARRLLQRADVRAARDQNHVGRQRDQLGSVPANEIGIAVCPAKIDLDVALGRPA